MVKTLYFYILNLLARTAAVVAQSARAFTCMRKVGCENPEGDRPKWLKQVVTAPLLNASPEMTIINRYPRHSKLANKEAIFLKHLQQIGHICHNVIIEFIKNELMDDLRPA